MGKENTIEGDNPYYKISNFGIACEKSQILKSKGKKVILTTGVFDIMHYKHAESLSCIKKLGDYLIVGIPSDELTRSSKKDDGPIIRFEFRAKLVSQISHVDLIFKKEDQKIDLIRGIQPNILVQSITSGSKVVSETIDLKSYYNSTQDKNKITLLLPLNHCDIVFIDDIDDSTTIIISPDQALRSAIAWENNKYEPKNFMEA